MNLEYIHIEEIGPVCVLKLNRPKALNALNLVVLKELSAALDLIAESSKFRVAVLTGTGDKAFIAGADISEMANMASPAAEEFSILGQKVTQKIEGLPIPVIAAVNGFALGGGCEMALACDFIYASSNAVFGQPEVCLGLITGFGGAVRLSEYIGWPLAKELIYTGRRISAAEAFRIGLVNKVTEPSDLLSEVLKVSNEIASNSPLAVKRSKQVMSDIRNEVMVSDKLCSESKAFSSMFGSFDQREGTKAFLEKRKPSFRGE